MKKIILSLVVLGVAVTAGFFTTKHLDESGFFSGNSMRLERYLGEVALSNGTKPKDVVEGARLISGDDLTTMSASKAYLLLDETKLLAMDQQSNININQEEEHLRVNVVSGSVFFNVTAPLEPEETLEFHTNNVVTGVRGTSGVITYDPAALVTQILVTSGTVSGVSSSGEEHNLVAGQVGIVTTQLDGSISFEVKDLEQDGVLFYYQDDFIDYIQDDFPLISEEIRLGDLARLSNQPTDIILPDHIQVIGDVRKLSIDQATAFAQAMDQVPNASLVTFVDAGNDTLLMVMGAPYEFFHGGMGREYVVVNSTLVEWTGSSAQILSNPKASYLSKILVCQEGTILSFPSDLRGASDVQNYFTTYYRLSNGQREELPAFITMTLYYLSYGDTTVNDVRNTLNDNGDLALMEALTSPEQINSFSQTLLEHFDGSYNAINGTITPGEITLGSQATPGTILQEYDCNDHTSPFWNLRETAYEALLGEPGLESPAPEGESSTETSDDELMAAYQEIFSEYRSLSTSNTGSFDTLIQSGSQFSYDFFDMDQDGTKELLVYMDGEYLTGIYSLQAGQVNRLADGYAFRTSFSLLENGLYAKGYYGYSTENTIYQLVNGEGVNLCHMEFGTSTNGEEVYTPDEATYNSYASTPAYVPNLTVFHTC